jgi:hypothetical protein
MTTEVSYPVILQSMVVTNNRLTFVSHLTISYCFLVILPELGKRNSGSSIQNSAPASEKPPELRQNSGSSGSSGSSGAQH